MEELGALFRDAVVAQNSRVSSGNLSPSALEALIAGTNDYTWEGIASEVSIRAVWTERKDRAARAAEPGGGLALLAAQLRRLKVAFPGLKLHLLGHSTGAFALGGLLAPVRRRKLDVDSLTLWAPACSMRYGQQTFGRALETGILAADRFVVEVLSEANELADSVAGLYDKSFLYLVSRALERAHKTPLMGLERSWLDREKSALFAGIEPHLMDLDQVETLRRSDGDPDRRVRAGHDSFDRSIRLLHRAIARMLGHPPEVVVTDLDG